MSLSSAENLGTSNLVFTYDGAEMNTPVLGTIHNFSGGNYETMTLTSPATNTLSLNIELSTDDAGTALATGSGFTDVAEISFTLVDQVGTANFEWQEATTTKTVVYQDDNDTRLTSGTLADNDMSLVDNVPPSAPSTPDMTTATDSGNEDHTTGSTSDNLTNDQTPTFEGTAEAGSTVKIFSNVDGQVGSGTATGGNYSITVSTLTAGAHTITATATDAASNVSGSSSGLSINIDVTQPTVSVSTTSSDPTNDSPIPVTITFNSEADNMKENDITVVNGTTGDFASADSTTFTVNITPSGNGAVQVSVGAARAFDQAGNGNTVSNTLSLTYDGTAPSISSVSLDGNNGFIDVTFDNGVYNTNGGSGALQTSDFALSITGGTATSPTVTSVTNTGGAGLSGGETTIRVNFSVTGSVSGAETLEVDITDGSSIFDEAGNAAAANQTSNNTASMNDATAPSVSSIAVNGSPATNATTVNFDVTFSESVTGVDATDFTVDGSGVTGTIGTVTGSGTSYSVPVNTVSGTGTISIDLKSSGTSIIDGASNAIAAGFTAGATHTVDTDAPTFSEANSTPTDNATGVATTANIILDFSENISPGTGNITLRDVTGSTDVESFNIFSAGGGTSPADGAISISNDKLYINPTSALLELNEYAIQIAATAIDDAAGNSLAEITDETTFSFTTADETAPTVSSTSPADNATGVDPAANITVTFNENMQFGTGFFQIKRTSDDVAIFSIDAADPTFTSNVASISGAVLTINPGASLSTSTGYYLFIHSGTPFLDLAGNAFTGFTASTDFNFTILTPNSAPSFTIGANQTVSQSAGAQTIAGHSTGMTDNDGSTQTLTFNVANNNNGIFDVQPDIDEASGNLTFTPKSSTFGKATVTVSLSDDGGTVSGGVDQSADQTFDIFITPDNIKINEVHASAGTDAEFIEVYNTAGNATSLSGLIMVWFNGNDDLSYKDFSLSGSTSASGFYVIGETGFASKDQDWGATDLQNGPDAVAIYVGSASDFSNGDAATTDGLVDVIVYGSSDDAALRTALGNPALQVAGSSTNSISRTPDGTGGFVAQAATPQATNDVTAPTVTNVTSSTADGTLKVGDAAVITVTFSEVVTVTGTPQLTLETGTTDRTINYNGTGSGTTTLEFGYTVQAGDVSADLDYVATNSLTAGTSIQDAAGNDATLTLASPGATNSLGDNKALVIDGVVPTVTSVGSTSSTGSYKIGDVIPVTVTFSEAVTVTGTPQIELETGTTDRTVDYTSGSTTTILTFNYTVQAGDFNGGGLDYTSTSALALNSGTIKDAAGNAATLTLATPGATNSISATKSITIDTTDPAFSALSPSSSSTVNTANVGYTLSEALASGTVTFTRTSGTADGSSPHVVTLTGTELNSGVRASAALTNAPTLVDGAVYTIAIDGTDGAGNTATTQSSTSITFDTTSPTVTSVSAGTADGRYNAGDVITVSVTFSESVLITGTPQITLETGTTDRTADYTSGSGGTMLEFQYTVQAGDESADLDYVSTSALALNGGTINDVAGNAATLTLASPGATNSLGANKDIVIDNTAPTVTSVSATTANGSYKEGDVIAVTVTFSEAVIGDGQIELETGTTDQQATYSSGSGTTTLTFNYTIQSGDVSADLDYTSTTALTTGTSIRDAAGNDATLTLPAPAATNSLGVNKDLVIDTTAPTVTSVTSTTADGSYKDGDLITITVTFSEVVTLSDAGLELELGATDQSANYSTGSGSSTITLNYFIGFDDGTTDLDYTSTTALTSSGIHDAAGNFATLTLPTPGAANSLGANKAIVIDNTAPIVTSVSSTTADGSYKQGDVIAIAVTFSEVVNVTGTPDIILETGTSDQTVNYSSGTGTSTLTFNYTVQSGDVSADLDYNNVNALSANGTIRDVAGNDANLTLATPGAANSLGANKALVIDTTAPTVTSVSSTTADGAYKIGDVIAVTVTFNEIVTVTGTPQIELEMPTTSNTLVSYSSGSGTTTLTFNYTVQFLHESADLDYSSNFALTQNGGAIQDAAQNDANLELPSPGATNSLGANKAIVIDTSTPQDPVVTTPSAAVRVNAATATISGTHNEDGVTVHAYADFDNDGTADNASSLGNDVVSGGNWSLSVNLTADSDNNFVVQAVDAAGNESVVSDVPTITEDSQNPTVSSTSPLDNATDVGITGNYTITFNEDIAFGTGNITLVDITGAGTNTIVIDAASPGSQASISGAVLTINPTAALELNNNYSVQIAATAIDDTAGNSFAGITDNTTLNFTTINTSVAFSSTTSSAAESTSSADLEVTLNAISGATVTVDYTVVGTATGGGTDYTLASGTLTINAGSLTNNITIASIIDDVLDENDETVIVTLSNPTNAGLGTNTQHTYTINDDDATPTVAFNTTASNGAESVSSADLQVDLSAVSGRDVTVNYTITGTATSSGTDYTLANGALVISAGDANNNITIASIVDDALDETDETVIVTLSSPVNATLGTNTVHTYTINDDDATPTVAFSTTSSSGAESTATANLQVDLSAVSGQDVMVNYTVAGTASGSGTDYTLADGTLTFTAGSSTENITIASIIGDALDEDDETVIVTLSSPTNATLGTNTVHTYTIQDDDASPTITFTTASSDGAESVTSANVTVDLSTTSGRTVTADYTVSGTATGGGTDYTLADGTLTFTAGDVQKTITIAGIVDDAILEANETVIITLSNLSNASAGTNQVYTYTINNNDAAAVTIADNSGAENGGDITVTATLDNAVEGGFKVDVSTADGTAQTSDSDYTAVTSQTLTFAGNAGETQTFIISPTTDIKVETNETLTVSQGNLANTGLSVDISDGATVTINNDDTAIVTIADVTAAENSGTQAIIATLSGEVQGGFAFDVFTADGTGTVADSDYSSTAGSTLTFAGTNGETQQLSLGGLGDTKVEADETFTIGMQNVGFTSVNTTNIDITDVATYTITNDDAATLAIDDVTKAENADGATTTFTFTTTLTGTIDQAFTVDYATSDGTAAAGSDYTAASGTLNFVGNPTGETQTFSVIVSNDALVEGDETFTVTLSNVQAGGKNVTISDATGTGTITNDDNAAVTIADISGTENGGDITVTATLDNEVVGGFTVDVSTTDGTATTGDSDYTTVTSQTLTFAGTAGETQTFTVSPTADTKFETDETLTVAMSNLVSVNAAASSIDITDGATVTIDNDDTEPVVTLSVDNNSIAENGGTATLTATLSNLSVNNVDVTIGYGGTAANGTDYNSSASTTITVSAGSISATAAVIITAVDDASPEGDETIIADITGVSNGSEDGTQSQTITIVDDDAAIVTSIASSTANGSYKAGDLIEIQVNFNRAVNVTGTPQLTLETGTTDQTADYVSGDGTTTLTFNYTVQAGDVSSDLDYVDANALGLNGGTIMGSGINAILDLPAPGATNSLGDNAAIIVDTSSPADPIVTTPATDILLNAATQTVSGTHGEDGVTINLYADSDNNGVADNASVLATATVSGNAWSLTASLTGDAANNFVVQAADAAGNTSADVDVPTITEDSTDPVITSDGGAATAGINVNENSTAVTTVTATDDNAVTFTISGGADQALFSMASGVLTFTAAPDFENPGDADTDNAYIVEVTASDGVNTDDTQTITVTVVDLDDNSPVITSDGGGATAALNVNENATAVTTVTATDADGVSTVAYSISGGADQALFSMASGVLTFTAAPDFENPGDADTDNAYVVEVTATDGNTTADTQTITVTVVDQNDNTPVITASQSFNVDETAADGTSVGTVVATDQDAGTTFSSWMITAGNTAGIFAVNAATGEVTISDNTNLSKKDVTASYTLTLTVSDGANTSATETITINILDTTAPAAPVVTGISDDTGSSSTDGITSDRNLLVHGTAEANSNVEIFSGAASVGTVQADGSGNWTLDITAFTLNENTSNVTAEAVDATGNRSATSAVFVLTIDFTAPAKPAVTHISDDTGSSGTDGVTSDRNILVHGTAEANSSVEIFSGAVSVGTVQADGSGDWTLDITGFTLTQSVSNVTAVAEDAAGNRSATSDIFVLTIDFAAPAKPVITSISDDTGSNTTDGITSDKTLSFTGTAEANSTVEVFIDGTSIGTTTADGSGDFTYDHTATTLSDGTMAITARATDTAGNQSVASDAFSVTVDTVVPVKAVMGTFSDDTGISNTDGITTDGTFIFSGTAEPLSSVTLIIGSFRIITVTADVNGDWVADFTHRSLTGSFSVIASSEDAAGNVSTDSDPLAIVIDQTDPRVSSINRADPSPTAATSVDFTVTFDEEVHGLGISNFGLAFLGTQNASIASISATSGTSVTVTVNNITGEGTFGLNLTSTTGITDVAGNNLAGTFTGQVYTTNTSPTDISLSSTSILENNSIGDAVGTLGSSDIDAGDTHTYTFVSGTGDADNASFTINGTQLEAAAVFDRETKASYNIRLQTDDGNGGTFQKAFTIAIDNVAEADLRITGNNDIPATPLGITTSFDITIHNDGDAAMSVTSILYPTAFGGPVSGINIPAASSQVVTMTFTPTVAQVYTGDITIVTNGGTGILSVSADGAIITGTDDGLLTADAINIYPNPASDLVTVDLSEFNGRPLDIQLFDLSGTKAFGVTDFKEATLKLDIRAYQQGIYLMYFTDGKSTVQKKFMIRK